MTPLSMLDAQRKLRSLGYDVGTPDGSYGPHTRRALLAFQKSHGLTATGRLDAETTRALEQ